MNFLVTGASGLIGSALLDRLAADGNTVICQSRRAHADRPGQRWIIHDLLEDNWATPSLPPIDVVYHLAGQTSTYAAQLDPLADLDANVTSLLRLLEHFRRQPSPPFVVLAGTVTEAGLVERLPLDETVADHPVTFYDISKLAAEAYLGQYVREGWIRGCTLRLANVYGRSKSGQRQDRGVIDKVFSRAVAGNDIAVYGDGGCIRDYVFIDDVASAFLLAPLHPDRTNGRTFCIGTGRGITLMEAFMKVAEAAASITGKRVACVHVPPPEGMSSIEFRNAIVDSAAFRQATGWTAKFDFEAGLNAACAERTQGPL